MPIITRNIQILSGGDLVAPVLTSPTGTATGPETAAGTVTTDEGNGLLYFLVSTNATESAATVMSTGSTQAVASAGLQTVSFSGLTAETTYYAHYVHEDAAENVSARVSSSSFTTDAVGSGGVITRNIQIRARADSIVSVSGSKAGSPITVNTGGVRNLTVNAPTLTYGGLACTSISVVDADTFTCVMPSTGLEIGASYNFVLTVLGVQSAPFAETYGPLLDEYETLTVDWADLPPDSALRDGDLTDIVVGTQIDYDARTSATTNAPLGYLVDVTPEGSFVFTGYDMRLEDEAFTVDYYLIDPDDFSRSNVGQLVFSPLPPIGDITIGTVLTTASTATIPFTFSGTNLTGYQYRIGSGSWTGFANSPLQLTGLTASTAYTVSIRAVNGIAFGTAASTTFSTAGTTDTTPDQFTFTDQIGVAISTAIVSNSIAVTGVTAGENIAISVTGGEYSYSLDNGATWEAWTSGSGNVRLNYLVRVRRTSSASYATAVSAVLTIGGVSDTFTVTTTADNIAPVITLTGGNVTLTVGDAWSDPGYSATDNVDGDVTGDVVVTGAVDTATPGAYTVTYTVTDAAGNVGTTTRTVTVVQPALGLQIVSVPAEIRPNTAFTVVVDEAVVEPTVDNVGAVFVGAQNPSFIVNSVTGSGPWEITLTPSALMPIQFSYTGYPIRVTVGAETAISETIPYLSQGAGWATLEGVATGVPHALGDHFTTWPLEVGHQIIHTSILLPGRQPVRVSPLGVASYIGTLFSESVLNYRVMKQDGTLSPLPQAQYTFPADSDVEYINDVVPRLLVTDVNLVRIFLDRDNTVRVRITHDGTAINMEQFSRFVLSGFPVDIDSDDNPEVFDVTEGDGVLDLMLGQILTSPGVYKLRLVGYSQLHTNGVVLFDSSLVDASVTAIVLNA